MKVLRPQTLDEALLFLREHKAIPFAGGTDLMVQRKRGSGLVPSFKHSVIFIGNLAELKEVSSKDGRTRVGSACPYSSLLGEESVPETFKRVLIQIASPAVRNRGTIGGNIMNASPAGDTLPYLYAVDADTLLEKWGARRLVPVRDLVKGPGQTVRMQEELLTAVIIPKTHYNRFFYKKVGTRRANSCSKLSFVGLGRVTEGVVQDVRMCFGAVAPTVVREQEIEEELKGMAVGEIGAEVSRIKRAYGLLIKPIDDQRCTIRYRKEISLRLLDYFLNAVLGSET